MYLLSSGNLALYIFAGIIIFILFLLAICIKIVPQAHAYVVEKLGSYHTTLTAGVHWIWPIFFKITKKILLSQENKELSYKIPKFKELIAKKIDNYKSDIVIEGHYHQGCEFKINGKDYINLPCFASERSYFIVQYNTEIKFQPIRSPNV